MTQSPPAPGIKANNIEELLKSGWTLLGKGELDSAEEVFRKACMVDPKSIEAFYALGLVLKSEERKKDAITAFEHVIKLIEDKVEKDPTRARMLRRLALGHVNQLRDGDWNLEKEIWQKKA